MNSKKGKISMPHNYFPVYCLNNWVLGMWKTLVKDESLVALGEVLFYLVASKLDDYEVYIE